MLSYFITLAVYLLSYDAAFFFTKSLTISLLTKLILTSVSLYIYRKDFAFKLRFDEKAIWYGIGIFFLWVTIDPFYPQIGAAVDNIKYSGLDIGIKLLTGIILAAIVEEFFTRFFLHRYIQAKDWKNVPLGKYSLSAFIVTVLFFGFSHSRWLAGILTGVLLNILYYKAKDMNSVVVAHAVANLCLWLYVVTTSQYFFW